MGNFTDTLKRLTDGWRKLKTTQQILIIGIIVIAIILVGVISTLLGQVNYVGLFPGSTLSAYWRSSRKVFLYCKMVASAL